MRRDQSVKRRRRPEVGLAGQQTAQDFPGFRAPPTSHARLAAGSGQDRAGGPRVHAPQTTPSCSDPRRESSAPVRETPSARHSSTHGFRAARTHRASRLHPARRSSRRASATGRDRDGRPRSLSPLYRPLRRRAGAPAQLPGHRARRRDRRPVCRGPFVRRGPSGTCRGGNTRSHGSRPRRRPDAGCARSGSFASGDGTARSPHPPRLYPTPTAARPGHRSSLRTSPSRSSGRYRTPRAGRPAPCRPADLRAA